MIKQSYTTVSYLRPLDQCYGELPHRLSSWSGCWSSHSDPDRGERSSLSPAASSSWVTIWIWSCKKINVKSFFNCKTGFCCACYLCINQGNKKACSLLCLHMFLFTTFCLKNINQHQPIMNQLNFKLTYFLNFLKILWTKKVYIWKILKDQLVSEKYLLVYYIYITVYHVYMWYMYI